MKSVNSMSNKIDKIFYFSSGQLCILSRARARNHLTTIANEDEELRKWLCPERGIKNKSDGEDEGLNPGQ